MPMRLIFSAFCFVSGGNVFKRHYVENSLPECLADYKSPSDAALQKAKMLMDKVGVFDGHNDLPMTFTYAGNKSQD